jgi:hypothetical protein
LPGGSTGRTGLRVGCQKESAGRILPGKERRP